MHIIYAKTDNLKAIKSQQYTKHTWRCRGSNPGPFTCKANALPLSYIPIPARHLPIYLVISGAKQTSINTYVSKMFTIQCDRGGYEFAADLPQVSTVQFVLFDSSAFIMMGSTKWYLSIINVIQYNISSRSINGIT